MHVILGAITKNVLGRGAVVWELLFYTQSKHLAQAPQGIKGCLIKKCAGTCDQASFPDLHLPPNDPDSCLPQLLQQPQPPVLFRETSSARDICMDCSSSFKGEGEAGGVFVILGWVKRREIKAVV